MDPTTLITFLFKAPPSTRAVELLGSWDNFSRPYIMHHDRRRGLGAWSGCFKFENIMFDGDSDGELVLNAKPRHGGGLKQGGTYWYYYRLDYDVDAYDDRKEHTTGCPLLPGQPVNVIQVPIEVVAPPSRRQSACMEVENVEGTLASLKSMPRYGLIRPQQTMNPDAKFAALQPPPVSKVHGRCVSDLALSGRLEGLPRSSRDARSSIAQDSTKEIAQTATRRGSEDASAYQSIDSGGWRSRASSDALSSKYSGSYEEDLNAKRGHPDLLRCFPLPASTSVPPTAFTISDSSTSGMVPYSHDETPFPFAHYDDNDDDVDSVYGPGSIQDVQLYGSRPTTSHKHISRDSWRPRVQSVMSQEKQHRWVSAPQSFAESQASNDECTSPSTQEDVRSPTFSAATISSSGGGLNTPFRLSAGYDHSNTLAAQAHHEDDQHGSHDLADRSCAIQIVSANSSPREELSVPEHQIHPTPNFDACSLPLPAMESLQSLSKVPTKIGSLHRTLPPLPWHTFVPEISTGSIADDIFSELGYLSGSIS